MPDKLEEKSYDMEGLSLIVSKCELFKVGADIKSPPPPLPIGLMAVFILETDNPSRRIIRLLFYASSIQDELRQILKVRLEEDFKIIRLHRRTTEIIRLGG